MNTIFSIQMLGVGLRLLDVAGFLSQVLLFGFIPFVILMRLSRRELSKHILPELAKERGWYFQAEHNASLAAQVRSVPPLKRPGGRPATITRCAMITSGCTEAGWFSFFDLKVSEVDPRAAGSIAGASIGNPRLRGSAATGTGIAVQVCGSVPEFLVRALPSVWTWLAKTPSDVEFVDDPGFSQEFLVLTTNPAATKRFLSPQFRQFICDNRHLAFGGRDHMVVATRYRLTTGGFSTCRSWKAHKLFEQWSTTATALLDLTHQTSVKTTSKS